MKLKSLSLLMLAVLGAPLMAQAAGSPHSFTANVGLYSQYIFRGMTQTGEDPALQGGFDYSHSSGLYAGVWGSNISWLTDWNAYKSSSLELDAYAGFRNSIGKTDFTYDVGVLQYYYPGSRNPGVTNANTTEVYAALGWKWLSAKYSYALTDTFGVPNSDGSNYLDLSASVPIGETGLTAGAHWGQAKFEGAGNSAGDYEDWKVSLAYDMGKLGDKLSGVTVGVMYTDTNAKKSFYTDPNGVFMGDSQTTVWVSKTF